MINLDRLTTWLNQANLQQTNNPLWQVINSLIKATRELQVDTEASISGGPGGGGLANQQYLTWTNNLATLPFSRQLMAGDNVTFDDSVFGQRTIDVNVAANGIWVPLTDGVLPETQIVFDGFGSCIMVFVPQP